MKTRTRLGLPELILILSLGWMPAGLMAANTTWTGSGADDNWTTALNWSSGTAAANDSLFFDGSTRLTPNNNFTAGRVFNGITFNIGAGAFTLTGNRIVLNGDIVNNSANLQTIDLVLTATNASQIVNTAAGDIRFTGTFNSSSANLVKTGTGTLTLVGNIGALNGGITINEGTVRGEANSRNLGPATAPVTLNGGNLVLAHDNNGSFTYGNPVIVQQDGTITFDRITSGNSGATTRTMGDITIGAKNLTINKGSNFTNSTTSLVFGAVNLVDNATFTITTSALASAITFGAVNDGGNGYGFTKEGDQILTLSSTGAFSGTVTLNAGTLRTATDTSLGSGTVVLRAGTLAATTTRAYANSVNLDGNITFGDNSATSDQTFNGLVTLTADSIVNITRVTTFAGGIAGNHDLEVKNVGVASAGASTFSGTVNNAGAIINSGAGAGSTTISGVIGSNVTGVTQNSASSALILSGSNGSYSGTTTLNAGVLRADHNNALGTGDLILNGGTFSSASDRIFANSVKLGGGVTLGQSTAGTGALTFNGLATLTADSTLNIARGTTFAGGIAGSHDLEVKSAATGGNGSSIFSGTVNNAGAIINSGASSGSTTISGVIGANVTGVTQNSASSALILSGSNVSYSGTTTLNAGLLRAETNTALGTGDLILNGGTLASGGTRVFASSLDVKVGGEVTFGQSTGGTGALTFNGLTTLTADSILHLVRTTDFAGGITGNFNLTLNSDAIGMASGNAVFSGPVNIGGAIVNSGTGPGGVITISGVIGSSVTSVTQNSGSSTLVLSGSNASYFGPTTVNSGTLRLGNAMALGSSNLAVNGGMLDLNGNSVTVGLLSGSSAGLITTSTNTAVTLTGSNAGNSTYAGTISNGSGTVAFTKAGAGVLTFTGSNTYSGPTIVNAGTLLINNAAGSGAGSGDVTVNAGGRLGGTGSFSGAVTVNGGTLAPGASIETLGSGTLTLNDGSTFAYEVDSDALLSAGADRQKVTGDLNLNGIVSLTLSDIAITPELFGIGTTFTLINYTGAWNGGLFTFGGVAIGNGGSFTDAFSNTWQLDYDSTINGSNFSSETLGGHFVNITAVPEPNTFWTLVAGVTALLIFVRKRSGGDVKRLAAKAASRLA